MKLTVFVQNQPVATLESPDGFRHVVSYHPDASADQFISLLLPVRTESYGFPDLHPIFRMNLPEGFLLSVLQEQLGPHVGASPLNLLSVVGRNAIGRVKVAPQGADPMAPPVPFELKDILRGDNSEEAFVALVRRFAVSGVSGVVPKFLTPNVIGDHNKGTVATEKFIIKGTTARLPGVALNEHFCMQVAARAFGDAARTDISEDGQALVVHRFDYAEDGVTRLGMEDLCSLLALRPEEKYGATWEQVVNRIKTVTPPAQQNAALSSLANLLLLTYALRNADCHTKNIALLYSGRHDIRLAPVYDMLTITAYDDYCKNPPGMSVGGRSSWEPGKSLDIFLQTRCGLKPADIAQRVERICQAMVEVSAELVVAISQYPNFAIVGPRVLHAWNAGMNSLRLQKHWSLPSLDALISDVGFKDVMQPYAPGAGAPPPELAGRDNIIESTAIALDRMRNGLVARSVMLVGLRGVGKTVLLNRLHNEAEARGFATVMLEAPERRSLPALLAPSVRAALLKLDRMAAGGELAKRALRALGGFVQAMKLKYGDIEFGLDLGLEPGVADTGDLDADLISLLQVVGEAARERKTVLVLFIDELQYVAEPQLAALITALHRCAQLQLPVTLVGAGLPQLVGQMGKAKSYAERLFEFTQVGPLPDPAARLAITAPAKRSGVEFEASALDEILLQTQGYPYFLQEWGKHSWTCALASPIQLADVQAATQQAIADLDASFFRVRLDRLAPSEKRYLRAMAELGPGPHRSGDIAHVLGREVQTAAPTRAKLIEKGMVYSPSHGDTGFTVPLFDAYMRRVMPDLA